MNRLIITLILSCGVYDALEARRYIAIPVDGIDVIELSPVTTRIARQAESYVPIAVPNNHRDDPISESPRLERSINPILDYVDFGGYTGSDGAFSWYADYPAHH